VSMGAAFGQNRALVCSWRWMDPHQEGQRRDTRALRKTAVRGPVPVCAAPFFMRHLWLVGSATTR